MAPEVARHDPLTLFAEHGATAVVLRQSAFITYTIDADEGQYWFCPSSLGRILRRQLPDWLPTKESRPRMSKPTVSMSRRQVAHGMVSTIAIAQLLRLAVGTKAVAAPIAPLTDKWAQSLGELARDLNSRSLTVTQWQESIEALHKTVPIADVLELVDFDRLRPKLERSGRFESHQYVSLPGIGPTAGLFWTNLFIVPEGGAIPPHVTTNS